MRDRAIGAACVTALLLMTVGCQSVVPYTPDREIVGSIPPDLAIQELRRLLGEVAGVMIKNPTMLDIELTSIDEVGFTLRQPHDDFSKTYRYVDLEVRVYRYTMFPAFIIRLRPGAFSAFDIPHLQEDEILFHDDKAGKEEVETLLDAVGSLKAAAMERGP